MGRLSGFDVGNVHGHTRSLSHVTLLSYPLEHIQEKCRVVGVPFQASLDIPDKSEFYSPSPPLFTFGVGIEPEGSSCEGVGMGQTRQVLEGRRFSGR